MLTEYLGTDLHKIVNELDKLIITLPKEKPIITTHQLLKKISGSAKTITILNYLKLVGGT